MKPPPITSNILSLSAPEVVTSAHSSAAPSPSRAQRLRDALRGNDLSARELSRRTGIPAREVHALLRYDINGGRVQFSRCTEHPDGRYRLCAIADEALRTQLAEALQLLVRNGYEVRKKGSRS